MKLPILALLFAAVSPAAADDTSWPAPTSEAKPWTRWWWLGSGVDSPNLTRELEAFQKAGLGGVEICPIYGAKGFENRDLPFLSPGWMAAYSHTAKEATRLGLGLDLTTGTGWPFGGPNVTDKMASSGVLLIEATATGDVPMTLDLPAGKIEVLRAWPETGASIDITKRIKKNQLVWDPPKGSWRIFGIASKTPMQKVKRAAPGGFGNVLDPFSSVAMSGYLKTFDEAFTTAAAPAPRSHFHDSFEYYGADWTPGLIDTFQKSRGYDLRIQLPALFGQGEPDTVARVKNDYRQTLDELHRGYLDTWHSWANKNGSLTRNQAHGSPGNLLDHYAVADIPETEIFRHVGEEQIPMLQFASSAAHVTGKKLTSAESFTWLGEHFQVTPAKLKEAADFIWLGGVNHLFFHGVPYTPEDAGWPGWLFYASTHMGPNGGLWRDLPAFNDYITRCQSVLQSGQPDAQVLVYFPVHDVWQNPAGKLPLLTVHNQSEWLHPSSFYKTAMAFWNEGIPCDFVSDRLLETATVQDGRIAMGGLKFKTLVIPETRFLPEKTAVRLRDLAAQGASVFFLGTRPSDVPGFNDLEKRRKILTDALSAIPYDPADAVIDPVSLVARTDVMPERMAKYGLRFVRRSHNEGHSYFIVNRSGKHFDDWVPLASPALSIVVMDPRNANRSGVAILRNILGTNNVRLVLAPGESCILRTFASRHAEGNPWVEPEPAAAPMPLTGIWKTRFTEGGPELPDAFETKDLNFWTARDDAKSRNFSGTCIYTLEFDHKGKPNPRTLLDLGEVAQTARVRLNGTDLGISWSPPHQLLVTKGLTEGKNTLEIEVTNLAANRIADLDRRAVPWKNFHEINFVNLDYKPFDASTWPPLPSGLLGPVKLVPLQ